MKILFGTLAVLLVVFIVFVDWCVVSIDRVNRTKEQNTISNN